MFLRIPAYELFNYPANIRRAIQAKQFEVYMQQWLNNADLIGGSHILLGELIFPITDKLIRIKSVNHSEH